MINQNQLKILKVFINEFDPENCYYYRTIETHTGIDISTLKKEIAELRKLGYMEHIKGLFNEDGETAGSGHQIPYDKRDEVRKIVESTIMEVRIYEKYVKIEDTVYRQWRYENEKSWHMETTPFPEVPYIIYDKV